MGTPGLPFTLAARCPRDSRTLTLRPYAAAQSSAGHATLGEGVLPAPASRPCPAGPCANRPRENLPIRVDMLPRHPRSRRARGFRRVGPRVSAPRY